MGEGNHALDNLRDIARAVDSRDGDILHIRRVYSCVAGSCTDCRSHQDFFWPVASLIDRNRN